MIPEARRRDVLGAAFVAVLTLLVDLPLIPAGVFIGDEAEAQTAPYILAIMHPTGFPFYTLAGWVFSHVVAFGTVAWRLNLFCAVLTALAAGGVVLLARALGSGIGAAVFAGLAYAFGAIVWSGGINANGQVLSATCSVYALTAAVVFVRTGASRALIAACALCGFGIAAHPASIWVLPGIALAVLLQRRAATPRRLLAAVAALVLPLALYAYLPLRSAAIATPPSEQVLGQPSLDPHSLDWEAVAPRTATGFFDRVLGKHEQASSFLLESFDPRNVPNAVFAWSLQAQLQYGFWLLVLAAAGFAALAASDRRALAVLAAGTFGSVTFAYAYRYDAHLDRYYLLSLAAAAALAASSSRIVLPRLPSRAIRAGTALALAAIAAAAFANNRPDPSPRLLTNGEAMIAAVARDTPSNAIVIAQWNEATALRYGAFVEQALGERTIIAANFNEYPSRYELWSRTRPVILYVPPVIWAGFGFAGRGLGELPSSYAPFRVFIALPSRPRIRPSGPLVNPRRATRVRRASEARFAGERPPRG